MGNLENLEERIQEEIKHAREVCENPNSTSAECAAAWDAVEELQAEAAHQRVKEEHKTSLEKYCEENPDAAECRIYDD